MTYTPVKYDQFAGLNLAGDPGEAGSGAVDILNVDPLQLPSRLVAREGFTKLTLGTIAGIAVTALHGGIAASSPTPGVGSSFVLAATWAGVPAVTAYSPTGTGLTEVSGGGLANFGAFVNQGVPAGIRTYSFSNVAVRYDSVSTFTTLPAVPYAQFAAVTPGDNRVAVGYVSGNDPLGGGPYTSRVRFSAAGDGDTWANNDYVDLHPGDGSAITGMATWGNDLYVLKTSGSLYRFYGTSTDATGNPVFNYSAINQDIGFGLDVTAGDDGIYVLTNRGIFRSRGGGLELVSQAISPLFYGFPATPYWQGSLAPFSLVFAAGRLYVFGSGTTMLVYTPQTGAWSYYSVGFTPVLSGINRVVAFPMQPVAVTTPPQLAICDATAIYRGGGTTDAGTTITSRYRRGFRDLGSPEQKTIRETILDGIGTVTLKRSTDWGSLDSGTAVTLGTAPTPAKGRVRTATRGRMFSDEISGTGQWQVESMTDHIREQRSPGDYG